MDSVRSAGGTHYLDDRESQHSSRDHIVTDQPFSRRRTIAALLLAPLASPIAAWLGSLLHGLTIHPRAGDPPWSVAAALVIMVAFVLFAAPVSYVATAVIVWPAALLLRSAGSVRWWSLTSIGALAGAALLPAYLHWLAPRGTFDFFPGVGLVSGAAAGWAYWFIAVRDLS